MRTIQIDATVQGPTHGRLTACVLNPRALTANHLHHLIGHRRSGVVDDLAGRLSALDARLNIDQRTLSHPAGDHGACEVAS